MIVFKNWKKLIIPVEMVPLKNGLQYLGEGYARDEAMKDDAVCYEYRNNSKNVLMHMIHCNEHDRDELVPSGNLWYDMQPWYRRDLHPRFSLRGALQEAGVRYFEKSNLIRNFAEPLLHKGITEREFIRKLQPFIRISLHWRGRRYRVTKDFKKKFEARSFTKEDFFDEQSQELRRIILNRGISIKEIIADLKELARDEEGVLYTTKDAPNNIRNGWLYVICPSTKQEYLLTVALRWDWVTDARGKGQQILHTTPAEARRATFGLPADAVFVKEA